jgi:hypothetical protein
VARQADAISFPHFRTSSRSRAMVQRDQRSYHPDRPTAGPKSSAATLDDDVGANRPHEIQKLSVDSQKPGRGRPNCDDRRLMHDELTIAVHAPLLRLTHRQ